MITLASVTTNFVNIYLSSLAWRTLSPRSTGAGSVWTIGLIGTALGLISTGWLTRFADLMVLLGSILVPVGGVFLALAGSDALTQEFYAVAGAVLTELTQSTGGDPQKMAAHGVTANRPRRPVGSGYDLALPSYS